MREDPLAGYFNKGGSVKIQSGDTLSELARLNNTTVSALASLNNIESLGLPPQYKYSGGPVNFGNMNFNPFDPNFDWDAFLNPEEEVEEVEEVIEEKPEVQYESVKQYETKPTGFRYQEGKTPFEMVDQEVVPNLPTDLHQQSYAASGRGVVSGRRRGSDRKTNGSSISPPNPTIGYTPETPYTTYQSGKVTFGNTNAPTVGK